MDLKAQFLSSLNDSQLGFYYAHENNPNLEELLQDELTKIQYDRFMNYVEESLKAPKSISSVDYELATTLDSIKDTLSEILSELSSLRVEQNHLQKEVETLKNMKTIVNPSQIGNVENWEQSTVTSGVFSASEIDVTSNADDTETLADCDENVQEQKDSCQNCQYYKEFLDTTTFQICDVSQDLAIREVDGSMIYYWITFVQKIRESLNLQDQEKLKDRRIVQMILQYIAKQNSSLEEEHILLLNASMDYCGVIYFKENDGLYLLRKAISCCWRNRDIGSKLLSFVKVYCTIGFHEPAMLKDELDIFRMLLDESEELTFAVKYHTVGVLCFYLHYEGEEEELPASRKILLELIEKEIGSWTLGTESSLELDTLRKYDTLTCMSKVPVCKLYGAWTLANQATLDPDGFGNLLEEHCKNTDSYCKQFSESHPALTKYVDLAFELTKKPSN